MSMALTYQLSQLIPTLVANSAIASLDTAINGINAQRAVFGAGMNRLEYAIDNLTYVSQNASASRSRVEDADYAAETTELAPHANYPTSWHSHAYPG